MTSCNWYNKYTIQKAIFLSFVNRSNKYDMHNEALKLWQSRKARRRHKDTMLLNKEIAEYFADGAGKKFLNELRQLLGRQRKQEQYVEGQRAYHRRMPDT